MGRGLEEYNTSSLPEVKSKVPDEGYSRLWHRAKVDSGVGLPMVNVLESTLELTYVYGESQLRHRVPYTMFFLWIRPLVTALFPS
jgi:hypothetical protein